MTENKKPYF